MHEIPSLIPFYITQKLLDESVKCNPQECAIAVALRETIPHSCVVIKPGMFRSFISIRGQDGDIFKDEYIRLDLSPITAYWMKAFDLKVKLGPTVMFFYQSYNDSAYIYQRFEIEQDEILVTKVNWREVNAKERELLRPTQTPESGTDRREVDSFYGRHAGNDWSPKANE